MKPLHEELVRTALANYVGVPAEEIDRDDELARDWGLDELDLILVALDVEDHVLVFEFPMAELEHTTTVRSLMELTHRWLTRVLPSQPALAATG
jgi:acyl carrier protein